MSCFINELYLTFSNAVSPSKEKSPDLLRIANFAIGILGAVGSSIIPFTLFKGASYINIFVRDHITRSIFSGTEPFPFGVQELAKSASLLANASAQLQTALLVTVAVVCIFGVLIAYRRYMHPDFYNQKVREESLEKIPATVTNIAIQKTEDSRNQTDNSPVNYKEILDQLATQNTEEELEKAKAAGKLIAITRNPSENSYYINVLRPLWGPIRHAPMLSINQGSLSVEEGVQLLTTYSIGMPLIYVISDIHRIHRNEKYRLLTSDDIYNADRVDLFHQ